MNIFYWNACAFIGAGSQWIPATLDDKGGHFTVSNLDGTVLSIQPDGTQQTRPAGTDAAWEGCNPDTGVNILRYTGTGIPYQVVYRGR